MPNAEVDVERLYYSIQEKHRSALEQLVPRFDIESVCALDMIVASTLLESGGDLTRAKKTIRTLFLAAEQQHLSSLTMSFLTKSYPKKFDNAVRLSNLQDSDLLSAVSEIFGAQFLYALRNKGITLRTVEAESIYPACLVHEPLSHQERLISKAIQELSEKKDLVIQMPTGAGKTTTAILALIRSGEVTQTVANAEVLLWIAPTTELVSQGSETFRRLWTRFGDIPVHVQVLDQTKRSKSMIPGCVIFTTYQGMASESFRSRLSSLGLRVRGIVLDEAHRALAPKYRESIEAISMDAFKIGLTATPGRTAEKSKENLSLASFFDKNILRSTDDDNEINTLQNDGTLSRLTRTVVSTGRNKGKRQSNMTDSPTHYRDEERNLRELADDHERNRVILDTVQERVESGHRVIYFACNVDHARLLGSALILRGLRAASIDSATSPLTRELLVKRFKDGVIDILGNYSVFTAGFDAPGTDCVVITRPTTSIVSYSQMIGRALRGPNMGGATQAEVIEFDDSAIGVWGPSEIYDHFSAYWTPA